VAFGHFWCLDEVEGCRVQKSLSSPDKDHHSVFRGPAILLLCKQGDWTKNPKNFWIGIVKDLILTITLWFTTTREKMFLR
jgi:hypothetical protein